MTLGTLKLHRLTINGTVTGPPRWVINAEPHVLLRLRRLFPRVKEQAGAIVIADTPEVCVDLVWCLERWPLEVPAADRERLEQRARDERNREAGFARVLEGSIPARSIETALPLREYQAMAVELVLRSRGLLVGDDLGTGKTWIGIGLLAHARPAVVVTETHLVRQWEREIRRGLPGARPHILRKGTPYDVTARGTSKPWRWPENELDRLTFPDVLIMSYSKLAGWADTLSKLGLQAVIFDEAQSLRRGERSAKGTSAGILAASAVHRLALTATPVYNYGGEVFNLVDVVRPGELGTQEEFHREWCIVGGADREPRVRDPAALGTYLRRAGIYIRRTRKDIGRELPPLTIIPVELDGVAEVKSDDASDLARQILKRSTVATLRFQLAGELDATLRRDTGLAKAAAVVSYVRMLLESEAQIVLVGWHHAVYDAWVKAFVAAGVTYAKYTGEEAIGQKEYSVRAFVEGRARVLILSLRSGAGLDGLQFTPCAHVVFGELDWSPKVHAQVLGRIDRDGQEKHTFGHYLIANTGTDPIVVDVLGVKRQQALGIEDPDGVDLQPVNDAGRALTLARRYLESIGETVPEETVTDNAAGQGRVTPL